MSIDQFSEAGCTALSKENIYIIDIHYKDRQMLDREKERDTVETYLGKR